MCEGRKEDGSGGGSGGEGHGDGGDGGDRATEVDVVQGEQCTPMRTSTRVLVRGAVRQTNAC